MARFKCPCCGNYPFEDEEDAFQGICEICFYQNDEICVENPNKILGPNKLSLHQAKLNYQKLGVSEKQFANCVRKPYDYELPENNE